MLITHNIDIQAMLVWLTLPFYDFCSFRSVAVNIVYKLQFFTFITIEHEHRRSTTQYIFRLRWKHAKLELARSSAVLSEIVPDAWGIYTESSVTEQGGQGQQI